ncbi:MAG: short-chain fatty acyl-CoA regulator family protein [Corynebacterium sp.]|nr:short-chain fatty acyl-CoA regulator family protein [Corynebacterium sp.]
MNKHFAGARIHALRKANDLTQVAMAKQLELSTSYLNQLENNQRPLTVTVLMQLCETFDVTPAYFSSQQDLRLLADLQQLFPGSEEDTLREMIDRFPALIPRFRELAAAGSPATTPSAFHRVRDFFFEAHNYIDELDVLGEELATKMESKFNRLGQLATIMDKELGIWVRFGRDEQSTRHVFDPQTRELSLQAGLSDAQLVFEIALQYCLHAHKEVIDSLVAEFSDDTARQQATYGLAQYFAASAVMPYSRFLDTVENSRYDVDRVKSVFGTSFESTAQRMVTLQRPGARGIPLVFIRTDRAGNISKRQSSTAFHFSRTGGSCPLWVVHRAFETPNRITRQVATMPDGHAYLWIARHVQSPMRSFGAPRKEFAVALGCDVSQADKLIYADTLNLLPSAATPIGPGCTACPRHECPQRAFPQIGHSLKLISQGPTVWRFKPSHRGSPSDVPPL